MTLVNTDDAAEILGVAVSTLKTARLSGMLKGRPVPEPSCTINRQIMYDTDDLHAWLNKSPPPIPRPKPPALRQRPPDVMPVPFFAYSHDPAIDPQPGSPALMIAARHKTAMRARSLKGRIGVQWRYRTTADDRTLLLAAMPLPYGDTAAHCHLADSTPAALSIAAEELITRVWIAAASRDAQEG